MFYVHDIDGLRFKGPMEKLEEQRQVTRRPAVAPLKEIHQEEESKPGTNRQALTAYQKIIKPDNIVEPLIHIYQIMSSPVSTIAPDISLIDAWWMLKTGNIRQLVVTTPRRELIGVLSDRDILRHLNVVDDEVEVSRNLSVRDAIEAETITTDAMSDIRRVAKVMAYYHRDAMPVLDEERLTGIVTRGDILRGFAENPKLNLWA